jgi:hypothetical protein
MSVCTFIAANCELPEKEYPEEESFIDLDTKTGTVYDGDSDDNYCLFNFDDVGSYSDLSHGVVLEWNYCTAGRAGQIIKYIEAALEKSERVELWTVWLMDYYEYEDRPVIKKQELSFSDLAPETILEFSEKDVWGNNKSRPTYYCLSVRK